MSAGTGHVECLRQRWYLRIRSTVNGVKKQHRITLGGRRDFRSAAAARVAADSWLARQSPSTLKPGALVTFAEYAQRFTHDHVRLKRKTTQRKYRSNIRCLEAHLGGELLAKIDAARIQSVLTELAQSKARSTVQSLRSLTLQILATARSQGFGAHVIDPRSLRLPQQRMPAREKHAWTPEQLERLLTVSHGQWAVLWVVMAYGGLRIGEALGLKWADVDLESGTLRIKRAATDGDLLAPKTCTSVASIPMLPRLVEVLKAYATTWRANPLDLLFAGSRGGVLRANDVRARKLQPMLAKAGLPHAGLHSFRHTTTRILRDLGMGAEFVRSFMRHGSLRMTEGYMHTSIADVRAALDAAIARNAAQQPQTAGPAL